MADQSDDLLPPPGPPPPKAKAMPAVLSNDPGKPPARLAPKPKIKSDDPASEAAASSESFLEPKSPDEPPPGWVPSDTGGKGKSDEVKSDEVGGKSDEAKSDEVGKGQGKSDKGKSDEVGKGQGKSDKGKSDEVGKGQGKSDQGKSESDHRKSGFWSTLPMARGRCAGGIPCPVMLLGAKLSSRINCVGHENQ